MQVPRHSIHPRRGLTLVETMLFAVMFAIAGVVFINVLLAVTRLQVRQSAAAQVNQETQFLLQTVSAVVSDALLVDMTVDSATNTLRLRTVPSSTDPTTIFASGTTIYIRETEGADPEQLTSDRVEVLNLQFTRRVNPGARDAVDISFLMSFSTVNPQKQYSQQAEVSVARSSAATFDSNILATTTDTYEIGTSTNQWASINNTIFFNASSNIAIASSTVSPRDRLHVQAGDIYISTSSSGIILKNTGGSCYRYTVSTGGVLTKNSISCP